MRVTLQSALDRIGERTIDNSLDNSRVQLQRRTQMVDLYGIEFVRQGDANTPAVFRLPVTLDLIYYERFEFKLIFTPFSMPLANTGATSSVAVTINNTSLSTNGTTITPNPHNHTSPAHNHSVSPGISLIESNVNNVRVIMEDIDITADLAAQYGGDWINGSGVYPRDGSENYDLLKVFGNYDDWRYQVLSSPGLKRVEIYGNNPFNVVWQNYLKLTNVNR